MTVPKGEEELALLLRQFQLAIVTRSVEDFMRVSRKCVDFNVLFCNVLNVFHVLFSSLCSPFFPPLPSSFLTPPFLFPYPTLTRPLLAPFSALVLPLRCLAWRYY